MAAAPDPFPREQFAALLKRLPRYARLVQGQLTVPSGHPRSGDRSVP